MSQNTNTPPLGPLGSTGGDALEEMKGRWASLSGGAKAAVAAGAAVVGLVVAVKILPALIAAMGVGLFLALLFLPYWIPTIVAFVRKHPSKGGIFALNFFLGWTFIGWVVSFVWAVSDNSPRAASQTVIVNTHVGGMPTPAATYRPGDVVNGQRFDGVAWTPVVAAQPAVAAAPAPMRTA
jgi:hypothetical protein